MFSANNLNVEVQISEHGLNKWLGHMYSQQTNKQFTADGIQFTLLPAGDEPVKITAAGRSVFMDSVIMFSFVKPAGLFSVEGHGGIRLKLESILDVSADMQISSNTSLKSHEWTDAPEIQIGELNFPVETLSNCLIRYYKENMLDKVDALIASKLQLRDILQQQISQRATNQMINRKPEIYLNASLSGVSAGDFAESAGFIILPLVLHLSALISDKPLAGMPESNPTFRYLEGPVAPGIQTIEASLSYEGLGKMIKTSLRDREIGGKKFEVSDASVRFTSNLEIKVRLEEPIKGTLTITCLPRIEHDRQEIYLDGLKIDVNADNFIYKLSSPIIENIISSKILDMTPLKLETLTAPYLKNLPGGTLPDGLTEIKPRAERVVIDSLKFSQFQMTAAIQVHNAGAGIVINGLPEGLLDSLDLSASDIGPQA